MQLSFVHISDPRPLVSKLKTQGIWDQLLRYVGGNLLQRHYSIPFRAGIATYVIVVYIPQLTTSDLGPAFQIDFYSASTFITLFHTN